MLLKTLKLRTVNVFHHWVKQTWASSLQKFISAGEEIRSSFVTLPGSVANRRDIGSQRNQALLSWSFQFRVCHAGVWVWSSSWSGACALMEPLPSLLSALKTADPEAIKQEYSVSACCV